MKKMLVLAIALLVSVMSAFASTPTLLQEDFESDLSQWSLVRVGDGFGSLPSDVYIGNSPLAMRPCPGEFSGCVDSDNNYLATQDDAGVETRVDATVCDSDAQVSFWVRTLAADSGDYATVDYSLDGSSWTNVATHLGDTWTKYVETLPGTAGNVFMLRLWLDDGNRDFGKFDDVKVTCKVDDEVPEFSTVGAALVLAGAGAFVAARRRK